MGMNTGVGGSKKKRGAKDEGMKATEKDDGGKCLGKVRQGGAFGSGDSLWRPPLKCGFLMSAQIAKKMIYYLQKAIK